jgi:hypothetical protein
MHNFKIVLNKENDEIIIEYMNKGGRSESLGVSLDITQDVKEVISELENLLGVSLRSTQRAIDASVFETFGRRLSDLLFSQRGLSDALRWAYEQAQQDGKNGLRIMLDIQSEELVNIPWEYLYIPEEISNTPPALNSRFPLVRTVDGIDPNRDFIIEPPLRILGMTSSPRDFIQLDVDKERQRMEEALSDWIDRGLVWIDWLEDGKLTTLRRACHPDNEYHLFHFIGHAEFDQNRKEGCILLEDDNGQTQRVYGQRLAFTLDQCPSLHFAFINACETGVTGANPYSGVVTSLLKHNIWAAVAMQFPIPDEVAVEFAREFYKSLLSDSYQTSYNRGQAGGTFEQAASFARLSLLDLEDRYPGIWAFPVLYSRIQGDSVIRFNIERNKIIEKLHQKLRSQKRNYWAEAIPLCSLLQEIELNDHDFAKGMQAYARAKEAAIIAQQTADQRDWKRVIDECDTAEQALKFETEAKFYRDQIEQLRRQAETREEEQNLLKNLYDEIRQRQLAEAQETCAKILDNNYQNHEARIIRDIIPYEEHLYRIIPSLERDLDRQSWADLLEVIEEEWRGDLIQQSHELPRGVTFEQVARLEQLKKQAQMYNELDNLQQQGRWEDAGEQIRIMENKGFAVPADLATYIQARRDADKGFINAALDKLNSIRNTRDDTLYRGVNETLRNLEESVEKLDEIKHQLDTAIHRARWEDALKYCTEILENNPGDRETKSIQLRLRSIMSFLNQFDGDYVAFPFVQLADPYAELRDAGVSVDTTQADLVKAVETIQSHTDGLHTVGLDHLIAVEQRLVVDFLMHQPTQNWEALQTRIIAYFEENDTLPTPEDFMDYPQGTHPLIHTFNKDYEAAERQWHALLTVEAVSFLLLHNLMVFHYWMAQLMLQDRKYSLMLAHWHEAVGFWAVLSNTPMYLNNWIEERCQAYDVELMRLENLINAMQTALLGIFNSSDDFQNRRLDMLVENRAASVLARANGVTIDDDMHLTVGPRVMRHLGLEEDIARIAQNDKPIAIEVRYMFSQIGRIVIMLEEGYTDEAFEYLHNSDCGECHLDRKAGSPRLACYDCQYFDRMNVGYALLPDKAQLLETDALRLLADVHIESITQLLKDPNSDAQAIADAWLSAWESGVDSRQLVKAVDTAHKMLKREDFSGERSREIAWYTWLIDAMEAILSGLEDIQALPATDLDNFKQTLAACYANRSIDRNNEHMLEGSQIDAERALQLDSTSANAHFAMSYVFEKLSYNGLPNHIKISYARRSLRIAEEGLEYNPDESGERLLKRQVSDITKRLENLGGLPQAENPPVTNEPEEAVSPTDNNVRAESVQNPVPEVTEAEETTQDEDNVHDNQTEEKGQQIQEKKPLPGTMQDQIDKARQYPTDDNLQQLMDSVVREVYAMADQEELSRANHLLMSTKDLIGDYPSYIELVRYVKIGYQQRERVVRLKALSTDNHLYLTHRFDEERRIWSFNFSGNSTVHMSIRGDIVNFATYVPSTPDQSTLQRQMLNIAKALYDIPLFKPTSHPHLGIGIAMVIPVQDLDDELTVWCIRRANDIWRTYVQPHIDNEQSLRRGFELFRDHQLFIAPMPNLSPVTEGLRRICQELDIQFNQSISGDGYTLHNNRFYKGLIEVKPIEEKILQFSSRIYGAITLEYTTLESLFQINHDFTMLSATLDQHQQIVLKYDIFTFNDNNFRQAMNTLTTSIKDYDL